MKFTMPTENGYSSVYEYDEKGELVSHQIIWQPEKRQVSDEYSN